MLQEYVKNVQPDFMEKFVKRAPDQVRHFADSVLLSVIRLVVKTILSL
jgi:hypothetical protein